MLQVFGGVSSGTALDLCCLDTSALACSVMSDVYVEGMQKQASQPAFISVIFSYPSWI